MQVVTKILLTLGFIFTGLVVTAPETAYAACTHIVGPDGKWYPESTVKFEGAAGTKDTPEGCQAENELMGKILRFVSIISGLVIVAAVGMIIYAGFKYITSQGDPKSTESAKQQLWYSGVGLFIVLTAFTILKLFQNASGF